LGLDDIEFEGWDNWLFGRVSAAGEVGPAWDPSPFSSKRIFRLGDSSLSYRQRHAYNHVFHTDVIAVKFAFSLELIKNSLVPIRPGGLSQARALRKTAA
jgi:hypothetical protein